MPRRAANSANSAKAVTALSYTSCVFPPGAAPVITTKGTSAGNVRRDAIDGGLYVRDPIVRIGWGRRQAIGKEGVHRRLNRADR